MGLKSLGKGLGRGVRGRIAAGFAAARAPRPAPEGAAKAAPAVSLESDHGWRPLAGGRFQQYYAGSEVDWQKRAGPLWDNGAVSICLSFVLKKIAEPRPEVVTEGADGEEESAKANGHPLLDLLKSPNPEYTGKQLLQATAVSYLLAGEAFWVRQRGLSGLGATKHLWYVPHWEMEPVAPVDGGPTQIYRRVVSGTGGRTEYYHRRDVVHFKFGMDPRNPRRGWSSFRAMFQEVVTDREIAAFTATILTNLGLLGFLVSPDGDVEFEDGATEELKRKIQQQSQGDNRGSVIVADGPIKVSKAGYSPQELAITTMGNRPEGRIAAAFGLNTMAVNLPGGDASKKYANLKESRAAAWEDCVIPMLTLFAETVSEELLPEMGGRQGEAFRFCYDAVRDLLPDLSAEHKRARDNWKDGVWRLSEARKATGMKAAPGDPDGFHWQLVTQQAAAPEAGDPATGGDDDEDPPAGDDDEKEPGGGGGGDPEDADDPNDPRKEPDPE